MVFLQQTIVGESIYDQKPPNPKKIDTKGFLTDFGRNCRVKWHTESLPDSDIGKGVISNMASKIGVCGVRSLTGYIAEY